MAVSSTAYSLSRCVPTHRTLELQGVHGSIEIVSLPWPLETIEDIESHPTHFARCRIARMTVRPHASHWIGAMVRQNASGRARAVGFGSVHDVALIGFGGSIVMRDAEGEMAGAVGIACGSGEGDETIAQAAAVALVN
jgi:hypothetical protein